MPQYKLHYFNFRGLGELARLIMHYGGIPFEDVRFERDQWPSIKPGKQKVLLLMDKVMESSEFQVCLLDKCLSLKWMASYWHNQVQFADTWPCRLGWQAKVNGTRHRWTCMPTLLEI